MQIAKPTALSVIGGGVGAGGVGWAAVHNSGHQDAGPSAIPIAVTAGVVGAASGAIGGILVAHGGPPMLGYFGNGVKLWWIAKRLPTKVPEQMVPLRDQTREMIAQARRQQWNSGIIGVDRALVGRIDVNRSLLRIAAEHAGSQV